MQPFKIIGIDLGSNTLRAALMNSNFKTEISKEFIVGSARNLRPGGKLDAFAKERILKVLDEISTIFDFKSYPCVAVATEAFRLASDSAWFFSEILSKFGIKFSIIKGENESKFIEIAVKKRLEILKLNIKNPLIIDLGGASTEISYNGNYKSFKFGIVRFFNEFNTQNLQSKNVAFITKDAKEFITHLSSGGIILTSGVPTTLAALKFGLDYQNYDPNLVNGKIIKFGEFAKFRDFLTNLNPLEAEKKVGKNRQELIIAGLFLLESLLEGNDKFIVIDDGLREGIMISEILRRLNDNK